MLRYVALLTNKTTTFCLRYNRLIMPFQTARQFANVFNEAFVVVKKISTAVKASYHEFPNRNTEAFSDFGLSQCCKVDEISLETIVELGRKVIIRQ